MLAGGKRSRSAARILMTADAVGGVWQYCLELANGLCRSGSEVWLAVMGPAPTEDQARTAAQIPGLTMVHGDFRLEWMDESAADVLRAGDWLLDIAHDIHPDLIHLNGYAHAALAWQRPVIVVAHSCVLSWWRAVHGCDAPSEWDSYRKFVQRGLDSADLVVTPTRSFLQMMQSIYRYSAPSCVIWNGRTPAAGVATPKRKAVMTAGRLWDAAKNVAALADAAASLQHPVWLAGEETTTTTDAASLVRLGRLGEQDMRQRLAEALVFALPARYEPFGLAALEAAHAGCALVLGDIKTQRELWDGAAIFVHPDDTAGLARRLQDLLNEPEHAQALGAIARRRAGRFSAQRMVASYRRAYEMATIAAARERPAVPVTAMSLARHQSI